MKMSPYLTFDGECAAAFKLYAEVLDGSIDAMMRFKDAPTQDQAPPDRLDKVMHASLSFAGGVLMGSDAPPQYRQPMQGFSVSLHVADANEAERVWKALSEGGAVSMPLQETFWAERFGMLVDKFGTPWMVNCDKPA